MTQSQLEHRAFRHLEFRSGGDGRTLVGVAAPFNRPTNIVDWQGRYSETIAPGAFARTIAERGKRVRVYSQHQTERLPIGKATTLREDPAGLVAELRISETREGDEVLTLVRDKVLDGLSIGFRPVRQTWSPDRTARTLHEIALSEISVVAEPAYSEALVSAVRSITSPFAVAAERQLLELSKDLTWM